MEEPLLPGVEADLIFLDFPYLPFSFKIKF